MKAEDKDKFQIEFHKALMDLGSISDPIVQGVALFSKLSNIIEDIYNAGKIQGFADGYAEANKVLERKLGKLN